MCLKVNFVLSTLPIQKTLISRIFVSENILGKKFILFIYIVEGYKRILVILNHTFFPNNSQFSMTAHTTSEEELTLKNLSGNMNICNQETLAWVFIST